MTPCALGFRIVDDCPAFHGFTPCLLRTLKAAVSWLKPNGPSVCLDGFRHSQAVACSLTLLSRSIVLGSSGSFSITVAGNRGQLGTLASEIVCVGFCRERKDQMKSSRIV